MFSKLLNLRHQKFGELWLFIYIFGVQCLAQGHFNMVRRTQGWILQPSSCRTVVLPPAPPMTHEKKKKHVKCRKVYVDRMTRNWNISSQRQRAPVGYANPITAGGLNVIDLYCGNHWGLRPSLSLLFTAELTQCNTWIIYDVNVNANLTGNVREWGI